MYIACIGVEEASKPGGVYLEFFLDPPRGYGLLDRATTSWMEEAGTGLGKLSMLQKEAFSCIFHAFFMHFLSFSR